MDKTFALEALAALSQETRLEAFRLLIKAGRRGLCAGEIAEQLDVRQNTMSTNLGVLARTGLLRRKREGRCIRYVAHLESMRLLLAFLMEDCCGNRPETCKPLLDQLNCD